MKARKQKDVEGSSKILKMCSWHNLKIWDIPRLSTSTFK